MWLLVLAVAQARGQTQTVPTWQFEPVSSPLAGCPTPLMNVVGFDHAPDGTPIVAWQECEDGTGRQPRVFWSRKESAGWSASEYRYNPSQPPGSGGDYAHQMIVRPVNGAPVIVFAAPDSNGNIGTYGASPTDTLRPVFFEHLTGPQFGPQVRYALAADAAGRSHWATAFHLSNDLGRVRVDGATITASQVYRPRVSIAMAQDGGWHLLWTTERALYYSRRPLHSSTHETRLLSSNMPITPGDVRLVIDGAGVLHAIVRGYAPDSNFDTGTLVYLRSSDGGDTWTSPEYVDPWDTVPANPGIFTDISLAMDDSGAPAVTYWRSRQQLYVARRDAATGTWRRSVVAVRPDVTAPRAAQIDFDPAGRAVIAYYDQPTARLLLAREVPEGTVVAGDLAISGVVSPATMRAGATVTYTLTVRNEGDTDTSSARVRVALPAGMTLTTASVTPDREGAYPLPRLWPGGAATLSLTGTAPPSGDVVLVASVESALPDADASDDRVVLGSMVLPDACFVPTAGLAGLWRGDRSAANELTADASRTVIGGVTYAPGVVGDAFVLNGTDAAVSVVPSSDAAYHPGSGSFTVQAWVRTTGTTGRLVTRWECVPGSCGQGAWLLNLTNGAASVTLRDTAGVTQALLGTRPINDGVFHHVAFVIDRQAGELRLVVDGVRDATAPYTLGTIGDTTGSATPLVIGARVGTTGALVEYFAGAIDEVAVARRAFTDTELAAVASIPGGAGCLPIPALGSDADLATFISAAPPLVTVSGAVEYVLRTTNVGASAALDVRLEQDLPSGATLTSASPAPATVAGGRPSFTIGTLASGASAWAVVRATAPPVPGNAVSTVTASAVNDGYLVNNTATASVFVTRGACTLVPGGLRALWRANGTLLDAVSGLPGVARGRLVYLPGRPGAGLSLGLDGGGYVEAADAPALRPARFTLSAWVAPEYLAPGSVYTVIARGSSGANPDLPLDAFSYRLTLVDGVPVFEAWQAGARLRFEGQQGVPRDDWTHLAVTFDGTTFRMLLNGDEVADRAVTDALVYETGAPTFIGGDGTTAGGQFLGRLDDVAIYDRALSLAEVQTLAGNPSPACLANTAPILDFLPDRTDPRGEPVTVPLVATDANSDGLTYTVEGLPPGLTLDPTSGFISGTPVERGAFVVTVRVTDGIDVAESLFTWTIAGNELPVIALASPLPSDVEGTAVSRARSAVVTAADPDGDPVLFTFSGLPPGVSYERATDAFAGTIPLGSAGDYTVTVRAEDGRGGLAERTFLWAVQVRAVVEVDIAEVVRVTDAIDGQAAVLVEIVEAVHVDDSIDPQRAVLVDIAEAVHVADDVASQTSVFVDIAERVVVADAVGVQPAVLVNVAEQVRVVDRVDPQVPPLRIVVVERIGVRDVPAVRPSIRIAVTERVGVTDAPALRLPLRIAVVERIGVADRPTASPAVRLQVVERIRTTDGITGTSTEPPPVAAATSPAGGTDPPGREP